MISQVSYKARKMLLSNAYCNVSSDLIAPIPVLSANQKAVSSHNKSMMAASQQSVAQRSIQQDWSNREYIEVITCSVKKITDFLNTFDLSCRSRLATLNEKLTQLERKVEYIEARVVGPEPTKSPDNSVASLL